MSQSGHFFDRQTHNTSSRIKSGMTTQGPFSSSMARSKKRIEYGRCRHHKTVLVVVVDDFRIERKRFGLQRREEIRELDQIARLERCYSERREELEVS